MKKIFCKLKMLALVMMLLPFAGFAQVKNVISTHRVFPKVDKVLEFEKALAGFRRILRKLFRSGLLLLSCCRKYYANCANKQAGCNHFSIHLFTL